MDDPEDLNRRQRVVLIGNSFVGKTALVSQFLLNRVPQNYEATVGAAFHAIPMETSKGPVTLDIWDTAGQEKYRSLGPVYYRNSFAAILVYDITDKQSFLDVESWVKIFIENAGNKKIFLVENKIDLEENAIISHVERQKLIDRLNLSFFQTSATTGVGVERLFQSVAEYVKSLEDPLETDIIPENIVIQEAKIEKKCCK